MKPSFARALALKNSKNPTERESYALGSLLHDNSPLLVNRKTLGEHMYICGMPGSGKSAAIANLVEQVLSRGDYNVYLLDHREKNTLELCESMRAGCVRSGTPFRYFIDAPGIATHTFNLHGMPCFRHASRRTRAALHTAITGSTNGMEGYGRKFFGGASYHVDLIANTYFDITSWEDAANKVNMVLSSPRDFGVSKKIAEAAEQLPLDLARLAAVPALNTAHSSIKLDPRRPEAVYIAYRDAYDVAASISRAFLFTLFSQCENSPDTRPTLVIIDECQRVLGQGLDLLLQQGRSKIGLVLANQCLADLKTPDKDFRDTILNTCRVHWTFNTANKEEQKFISDHSGKVERFEPTVTYKHELSKFSDVTYSYRRTEAPRIGQNEISMVLANPELSVFTCTQDYGFIQFGGFPQLVHTEFHITAEEFQRRKSVQWPTKGEDEGGDEGTIVTPYHPPFMPPPEPRRRRDDRQPNIVNPGQSRRSRRAPRPPRDQQPPPSNP